ncbi:MAG: inositol monophosphatase family protein [Burkholderiales bacterium]|nr:inositol monophosphatase family protein [Burkholderiales bacterium]
MLEAVIAAVREVALSEVMPRFLKVAHERKADGSLFTSADLAAQEALVHRLAAIDACPVVAEEMTREQQVERWLAGDGEVWCVDPIDGTSNFVNGLPYFAVSVALMRNGRTALGVVFDPVADEMFCAELGKGAFLNGEPLPIKQHVPPFSGAMASVDSKRLPRELALRLAGAAPFYSQRNFGASTLEWCYTAAGRFDLYVHGGQKLWDYAAGSLILQEAGGAMCSLEEDDFWRSALWQRSVIAAGDPDLFRQWKSWIRCSREVPDLQ